MVRLAAGVQRPAAAQAVNLLEVDPQTRGGQTSRGTASCANWSPPRGSTLENGAANFYALHEDPQDMAETVSMAFLGMSINCARCHDHPMEKWTNDDYYGWPTSSPGSAARAGGRIDSGDGNRVIFVADSGELIQPRTGPSPAAAAARRQGRRPRFHGRSPRRVGRLADRPQEPVLQPVHRQPRLGQLHGPGTRRGGGRHAAHQPGEQSARC